MAYKMEPKVRSAKAGADLSAKQYYAVRFSAEETINLAGANQAVVGILVDKPANGEYGLFQIGGRCKAIAGGQIAAGKALKPTTGGKLIEVQETDDESISPIKIVAVTAAAADGDLFTVELY